MYNVKVMYNGMLVELAPSLIAEMREVASGDEWPSGHEQWSDERIAKQYWKYYGFDSMPVL